MACDDVMVEIALLAQMTGKGMDFGSGVIFPTCKFSILQKLYNSVV
ncbi:hypothetical protein MYX76_10515 [Desulfobacterota bacterium AH_259_B03_O07]|nr:hypothetical protein [Desulfobacterota bacterium AH_259_B03_O07]